MIAEAYRRKEFRVIENYQTAADEGVAVRLEKNNNKFLVRCKQWKSRKIGVAVICEMYRLMIAESATGVMIGCSGYFTQEAKLFAKDKPIELIGEANLLGLIQSVQDAPLSDSAKVMPDQEENYLTTKRRVMTTYGKSDNRNIKVATPASYTPAHKSTAAAAPFQV